MLTRQEAESIYDAGKETVVRVLLELSRKVDQLTTDFAALKAENAALRTECQALRELVFLREEQTQKWAKEMIDHLLGIKAAVATASAAGLTAASRPS